MINKKDKSEEIQFNNPFNNDFEIPTSKQQENKSVKEIKLKSEKPIFLKPVIIQKKPIVKIGFELLEELDREIEFIALDENKKKKDLLAEIIEEWIKNRKKIK